MYSIYIYIAYICENICECARMSVYVCVFVCGRQQYSDNGQFDELCF